MTKHTRDEEGLPRRRGRYVGAGVGIVAAVISTPVVAELLRPPAEAHPPLRPSSSLSETSGFEIYTDDDPVWADAVSILLDLPTEVLAPAQAHARQHDAEFRLYATDSVFEHAPIEFHRTPGLDWLEFQLNKRSDMPVDGIYLPRRVLIVSPQLDLLTDAPEMRARTARLILAHEFGHLFSAALADVGGRFGVPAGRRGSASADFRRVWETLDPSVQDEYLVHRPGGRLTESRAREEFFADSHVWFFHSDKEPTADIIPWVPGHEPPAAEAVRKAEKVVGDYFFRLVQDLRRKPVTPTSLPEVSLGARQRPIALTATPSVRR